MILIIMMLITCIAPWTTNDSFCNQNRQTPTVIAKICLDCRRDTNSKKLRSDGLIMIKYIEKEKEINLF